MTSGEFERKNNCANLKKYTAVWFQDDVIYISPCID